MEENSAKKAAKALHTQPREDDWAMKNWRAWGSWFSWGSPVGLGLFYALVMVSTGIFLWLIHQY